LDENYCDLLVFSGYQEKIAPDLNDTGVDFLGRAGSTRIQATLVGELSSNSGQGLPKGTLIRKENSRINSRVPCANEIGRSGQKANVPSRTIQGAGIQLRNNHAKIGSLVELFGRIQAARKRGHGGE